MPTRLKHRDRVDVTGWVPGSRTVRPLRGHRHFSVIEAANILLEMPLYLPVLAVAVYLPIPRKSPVGGKDGSFEPLPCRQAVWYCDAVATEALVATVAHGATRRASRRWSMTLTVVVGVLAGLIVLELAAWALLVDYMGGPLPYVLRSDFMPTISAAELIRAGQDVYDPERQRISQDAVLGEHADVWEVDVLIPYNRTPFEALLIVPFTSLPYPVIYLGWTVVSVCAFALALALLYREMPAPRGWLLALGVSAFYPVCRVLVMGQSSHLVLLGLCGTFVYLRRGREAPAGAALCLVALKPQTLPVLLVLLLLERRWRALASFAVLGSIATVAVMPVLGVDWPLRFLRFLLLAASWSESTVIDPAAMPSFRGLLTVALGAGSPIVLPLLGILTFTSFGFLAWARRRLSWDLTWALAGLVAVLTSFHLNVYDILLLTLPAWIIGVHALRGELPRVWLYGLGAVFIVGAQANVPSTSIVPAVAVILSAMFLFSWTAYKSDYRKLTPSP